MKRFNYTHGLATGALLGALTFSAEAALDYRFYGAIFGIGDPIDGTAVSTLLESSGFPDNPDLVDRHEAAPYFFTTEDTSLLTSGKIEWPQDGPEATPTGDSSSDLYGGAVSGILYPPVTGTYTFHVRSDDASALFLNPEGIEFLDPKTATPIAQETGCCAGFEATGEAASAPIDLEVGQGYAFEMLWKEGGGGDWMQVGWSLNGGPIQVIPAFYVQRDLRYGDSNAGGITGGTDEDPFMDEGDAFCCLGVEFDKDGVAAIQWQVDDGSGFKDLEDSDRIIGANSPALQILEASYEWNGYLYRAVVDGEEGDEIELEVIPDEDAPEVLSAKARGNYNGVTIFFSEPVTEETALDPANYSVSGRTVDSVQWFGGNAAVRLNLGGDPFVPGAAHTVSIANIMDRAALRNVADDVEFRFDFGLSLPITEPTNAWLFNEGSGTTAGARFGGRTGELQGGASWSDDSPFPGDSASVEFTGTEGDGVDMGDLTYNGDTQWSMSTWIRSNDIGQDRGFWEAVDSGGADAWGIRYDAAGASAGGANVFKLGITVDAANGDVNRGADQVESAENVQTTEWQHVVQVWNSGEGFSLYIDGELDESTLAMATTEGALADMLYFRLGDGSKAPWLGKVGETAVWSGHALTPEEVAFLSQNSLESSDGEPDLDRLGEVRIADGGQPANQATEEFGSASFQVNVNGSPFGRSYQWLRDGEPIEGATDPILELNDLSAAWDGAAISVVVANEFSEVTSSAATLAVAADIDIPEALDVVGTPFNNQLSVVFSERVDATTAADVANYSVTAADGSAVAINSATLAADALSVVLSIDPLDEAAGYTLNYSNIADLAAIPNIGSGAIDFFSFGRQPGGLTALFYELSGSGLGFLLDTEAGDIPDGWSAFGAGDSVSNIQARQSSVIGYFESPNTGDIGAPPASNVADNYAQIIYGHLRPEVSGDYRFFVATDDNSQLWLSEDADPANAELIAEEPAWNGVRQYDDGTKEDNWSDPIALEAGQEYFIELRVSEGGGGDNAAVAWTFTTDGTEPPVPANGANPIPGQYLISMLPVNGSVTLRDQSPASGGFVSPIITETISVTLVDGVVDQVDPATISMTAAGQSLEVAVDSSGEGTHVVTGTLADTLPGESIVDVVVSYQTVAGAAKQLTYSFETARGPVDGAGDAPPVGTLGEIVWVSFHGADDAPSGGAAGAGFTEAPDKAYTDLLRSAGYKVDRYITTGSPDASILETYDLAIVSRSVSSGNYSGDAATAWNNIAIPMIITGGYTTRSSRMGFTTGTTMVDTTGDINLTVEDASHPIFAGIALTDGVTDDAFAGVVEYADGTVARGVSINTDPLNGGTLLASIANADGGPEGGTVIAEWKAGSVLTHDGGAGTDVLLADRLVLKTGSREAGGISSETAGLYDLTATGAQIFLNAVDYMLHPEPFNVTWVSFHPGSAEPGADAAAAGFTEAPDKPYTDLLEAAGYNVTRYVTTGDPDVEALEASDLIIIGRGVSSGHYSGDSATTWNSIEAPILNMGGYTFRSNRLGFTTGTTMVDTTGDITLNVLDPSHAIFAGIPITDGVMDNVYAGVVEYPDGTLARGISINNNPMNGGTLLASIANEDGGPVDGLVVAEWLPGELVTHDGGAGTDSLAGSRLVLVSGSREASGITSQTAGLFDLSEDGTQMFLNAVRYGVSRKGGGGSVEPPMPPEFTSIVQLDGAVTIEWTGEGTLETTDAIGNAWTPVDGATSPYTTTPAGDMFFRLVQ